MFVQNFIELSAAVHELSCTQRKKNSDTHNTVLRYRAASKNTSFFLFCNAIIQSRIVVAYVAKTDGNTVGERQ